MKPRYSVRDASGKRRRTEGWQVTHCRAHTFTATPFLLNLEKCGLFDDDELREVVARAPATTAFPAVLVRRGVTKFRPKTLLRHERLFVLAPVQSTPRLGKGGGGEPGDDLAQLVVVETGRTSPS